MRLVALFVALTLPNPIACAAGSFLGRWDLNSDKSYIEAGSDFKGCTQPRRGSAKFTREQGGYDYKLDAHCKDGDAYALMSPATFDGRVYPVTLNGRQMISTARRVGDRSFKILNAEKQTSKVTRVFIFNVSPDDRTLIFTDLKAGEKTPSVTLVYDRR